MANEYTDSEEPDMEYEEGKLLSEWNMGNLDFNRYHAILCKLDELTVYVKMKRNEAINEYVAALWTLFINWAFLISNNKTPATVISYAQNPDGSVKIKPDGSKILIKKEGNWTEYFNERFNHLSHIFDGKSTDLGDFEIALEIHRNLMMMKQKIGLGIKTERPKNKGFMKTKAITK